VGKALGRLSRPRTRWQQRGGRNQKLHYPELSKLWIENARCAKAGLPPIPVPLVMTPAAIRMRELRALRRRRAAYERTKGERG